MGYLGSSPKGVITHRWEILELNRETKGRTDHPDVETDEWLDGWDGFTKLVEATV